MEMRFITRDLGWKLRPDFFKIFSCTSLTKKFLRYGVTFSYAFYVTSFCWSVLRWAKAVSTIYHIEEIYGYHYSIFAFRSGFVSGCIIWRFAALTLLGIYFSSIATRTHLMPLRGSSFALRCSLLEASMPTDTIRWLWLLVFSDEIWFEQLDCAILTNGGLSSLPRQWCASWISQHVFKWEQKFLPAWP